MGRLPDVTAGDLARMLAERIEQLAPVCLPLGYYDKKMNAWRCGDVFGAKPKDGSLFVWYGGPRRGRYIDFALRGGAVKDHWSGDALELVCQSRCNGDKSKAFRWALDYLGLQAMDQGERDRLKQEAANRAAEATRRAEERRAQEEEASRKKAQGRFLEAQEIILGTPVDAYLRGRGIDMRRFGRMPTGLRFHPSLWNVELQGRSPAMVWAISGESGFMGLHRTWLEVHADGRVTKHRGVKDNKKVMGQQKGGHIALWRGEQPDPETGELRMNPPIRKAAGERPILSEGVEDGLTSALVNRTRRHLATVNAGNIFDLWLPEGVVPGTLLMQREGNPEAERLQGEILAFAEDRWPGILAGWPPEGFKDINDAYCAALAGKGM